MLSLWRDTTSERWTPVLFFLLLNNPNASSVYFSAIYFLQTILLPHNMVNPLCSAKPVRLTTSLNSWDKVSWLFVCRLFHLATDTGSSLMTFQSWFATPSEATHFSYWSIKPWFLNRGKLAAVL